MALLLLGLQFLSGAETYRSTPQTPISGFRLDEYRVPSGVVGTFTVLALVFITPGDNYDSQFAKIWKYFSREVREIGSFSEEAMPSDTVERIRSLTTQAEELDVLVSQMELSGSVALCL